ncbi:MAG: TVP38/TMEM64 family protein [Myxococcota bacterium]
MRWRITLMVAIAAGVALAWWAGLFDHLEPERAAALLRDTGPWGRLAFVVALALANGLGSPAAPFIFPAIAVWPPLTAFLLIWAGAVGAGMVGYLFARTLGRDWVEPRLPLALRNLDERIRERQLRTVLLFRLSAYLLAPSHWALGLSSVSPGPMLVGTVIAFAPWSAFWAFAGSGFLELLWQRPVTGTLLLVAIVAAVFGVRHWRIRRARSADAVVDA